MKTTEKCCVLCSNPLGAPTGVHAWFGMTVHDKCTTPAVASPSEDIYRTLAKTPTDKLRDLARQVGVVFTFTVTGEKGNRIRKFYDDSYLIARIAARQIAGTPVVTPAPAPTPTPTPTPAPVTAVTPAPAPKGKSEMLARNTLGDVLFEAIEERIQAAIAEAVKAVKVGGPTTIEWKVNDRPFAKIEGTTHKSLPEVLDLIKCGFNNVLLVGPAGTGKSTLAHDAARALSLPFAAVSCSGGMSEWHLIGRSMPNLQTGESVYQPSDFVRMYENGGVFLIDEMDAADSNVMIVINSALANGHMSVPARTDNPIATRHKDFYVIAAANTYGNGATLMFVGRNPLDGATLDRFIGSVLAVDYDRDLEAKLAPSEVCTRLWAMREAMERNKIRRTLSTRSLVATAKHVAGGKSLREAVGKLTTGWTADEITKVVGA